jgi:ABC-type proline/glycine betaine transport system ATPase subunit
MKTVIIKNGVVVNVGKGEITNAPANGYEYVVVADDAYVGPNFTVNSDGSFTAPIQQTQIDE